MKLRMYIVLMIFGVAVLSCKGTKEKVRQPPVNTMDNTPATILVNGKMNSMLYIGIPNTVRLQTCGKAENITISTSASPEDFVIEKIDDAEYTFLPKKIINNLQITLTTNNGSEIYPFYTQRLPDPIAKISRNKANAIMQTGEFKAQAGLYCVLENFLYDVKCDIVGFELGRVDKAGGGLETLINEGARFDKAVRQLILACQPGDIYLFTNIKGSCPGDIAARKLNTLTVFVR